MKVFKKVLSYLRLQIRNRDFLEKYNEIKGNQSLPYEVQEERQLKKLNKLLIHAYQEIPYYNKLFKELGIISSDGSIYLNNLSELSKIPVLTKDIVRMEKDNLCSNDILKRNSYPNSSGGSTGQPVKFVQDKEYALSNKACTYLAFSWKGYTLYDDMVIIWGAERDTFDRAYKKSFKDKFLDIYYNRIVLNSFSMSDKNMIEYIQLLNKHKPKLIKAYAQSIYEIAKFAKKNNVYVKPQNAIHLAAGTVYESMRATIEEVFACKAYNYYGGREVGSIASECSAQDGLHIMMEHNIVEILNSNNEPCKEGEEGEIVVTTLSNYSMPLIRYKIGDVGILKNYSACECGCTYSKLDQVIGRTTDIFRTLSGSVVVPEYFIHLIGVVANRGNIKLFQVIQEKLDLIRIKIVKEGEVPQEDLFEIEDKVKIVMGSECHITFEFVEHIAKTITGKYRYTISHIN